MKETIMINGLMWEKKISEEEMSWEDAMNYAKNLKVGGYSDWRLPTIEEFRDIISLCGGINVKSEDENWDKIADKNYNNSSYENLWKEKGFLDYSWYWSSTPYKNDSFEAWIVYFNNGNTLSYDKSNMDYVRCVRSI